MEIKTPQQFIDLIAPSVLNNCKKHGWGVPSAIIAQATLESIKSTGWSGLASSCYNFWGMKWNSKYGCDYKEYQTKEQRADGSYYTVISKFCKAKTVDEGIDLYFKFIEMNKRYANVMKATDYTSYATEIRKAGWATSLAYTQNIINNVIKYGLSAKYDTVSITPVKEEFEVGKTYTTTSDIYIRNNPNGEKVKYDNITVNAKQHSFFDEYGNAILKKGTRVTCKSVKNLANSTWIEIPSGWIIAKNKATIYVK